jgi:phage protein D
VPISLSPDISLNGTSLSQITSASGTAYDALIEMRVDRQLMMAGRCTLRFVDTGYTLMSSGKMKIGATVVVKVAGGDELIKAYVTGLAVEQPEDSDPELVVIAHDLAHKLSRQVNVATFVKMTYSDIIKKVVQGCGLSIGTVESTSRVLEYVVQADSAQGLLNELATRLGYDWWVEADKLSFKKVAAGSPVAKLVYGHQLQSFSVRGTSIRPDEVEIEGWDRAIGKAVTGKAAKGDVVQSTSKFVSAIGDGVSQLGASVARSSRFGAASAAEATELSKAMLQRAVSASINAKGVADANAAIKPGTTVAVDEVGPLSGDYLVTGVEHVYRPRSGFVTRFTAGDRMPISIAGSLNGSGAAAPVLGPLQHAGLLVGVVTNNKDPETLGRIKVKFPGVSDKEESAWARLVAMGGGAKRGSVFMPEVGDEVLVGFEGDDMRQPVVLGGLYGKAEVPEWVLDGGKVQTRRITSRLGHAFEMSDGPGKDVSHINLYLNGQKTFLRLGEDKVDLEVPSGVPFTIKVGSSTIKISGQGAIAVEGTEITIKGKQSIKLEAPQIEIKGQAKVALAAAQIEVKANAMAQIDGGGMTQIKGGMVQIN